MKKKIAVLGSTGILGVRALQIIEQNPGLFEVAVLSANKNAGLLIAQAEKFKPKIVCLAGSKYSNELGKKLPKGTKAVFGGDGIKKAIGESGINFAFISIVGIAGLPALIACIDNNIKTALANKEALVCGGSIVRKMLDEKKTVILPVDSELSAVFQCLNGSYDISEVRRIILTASGGPFLESGADEIYNATPKEALRHPNWKMGRKITVDCATMVNKALEVMEARWLFNIEPEKIEVVVHRQSIIHSMVEYINGSVLAQMSPTDMKQPIQYAFSWPERMDSAVGHLDFSKIKALSFEKPDFKRFPSLKLGYDCLKSGDGACIVFNSANEALVELFLENKIPMGKIYEHICGALEKLSGERCVSLEDVYNLDIMTRKYINGLI